MMKGFFMEIKDYRDFEEKVLRAGEPVLVDFYASWCGPCKIMAPVVSELAESGGEFSVYKVDVDNVSEAAGKFGVSSIPTFIAFRNGTEIARITGAVSKQKLIGLMDKA